jgi:thioredoxin-related protein
MDSVKVKPKKVLVDFYTDWCGWCKQMDAKTFTNSEVARYINEKYYSVKFNAEKEGPITIGDSIYAIQASNSGKRSSHPIAQIMLKGKMSYPTIVYLDESLNILSAVPGFMTPEDIKPVLRFFGDNYYLKQSWQDFQNSNSNGTR